MQVFIVLRELQNDHGYIDTDVLAAYPTEAAADVAIRDYEDADLMTGQAVEGREDEWTAAQRRTATHGDWTVSYRWEATRLQDDGDETAPVTLACAIEVADVATIEEARVKLDAFREAVQPAAEYGLTITERS